MDEETKMDIAEALGKANALLCLQDALIETLRDKGVLTDAEILTLAALANAVLDEMPGVSADALEMAKAVVRGSASSWTKNVAKN